MNPLDVSWALLKAPVDPKKVEFEEKQRKLDEARRLRAKEESAAQNQTSLDNWKTEE